MAVEKKGINVILATAVLIYLLFQCHTCYAKTWIVGDEKGWTLNIGKWAAGKKFTSGDILVFKYDPILHNVVRVNSDGYNGCNANGGETFNSGNDQITVVKGDNHFICGVPGHCIVGQKIVVSAD